MRANSRLIVLPLIQMDTNFPQELRRAKEVADVICLGTFLALVRETRAGAISREENGAYDAHRSRAGLLSRDHARSPGLHTLQCDGGNARTRRVWTSGYMPYARASLSGW
jgi:hypothetical protein